MTSSKDRYEPRTLIRSISPPAKRRRTTSKDDIRVDTPEALERNPWERTPLSPELSDIRVLRIRKDISSAAIRCELLVVSLDDNPDFEVLSYVWGDCSITKSIHVDEVRFNATVNLFDFLSALRLESQDRILWADGICIDQKNEEEKSHQIGLMTRIYRQATEAHVWFGPFDARTWSQEFDSDEKYTSASKMTPEKWKQYQRKGTTSLTYLLKQPGFTCLEQFELEEFAARCRDDIFLQTLAMLDEMAKGDHLYTYPVVALTHSSENGSQHILNASWLTVMDCIRWLITRPWWSRVWTLQEAALPRVDPTVHAPPYTFRLSRLLNGVDSMWYHNNSICCKWFGQPITTSNRDDHEYAAEYTQCRAVHGQRSILAEAEQEGLGVPLDMVVGATQGRKATEIRDHWFGIFGFLPERWQEQSKLFPAHCTVTELFSQCSNLLYLESADLTQLDAARRCKKSLVERLPSWAIDLSDPRDVHEEDHRWTLFNACGKATYNRNTEWPELRSPELNINVIHVSSVQVCSASILPAPHGPEDLRILVND
ncbi:heterokaryon incompatibility protein-domain-containing protein [Boeremia exigua]|uniref:heterokaryon incompatibility protein-domain-containing protein n=1 Tax=Boeremia exigua TaxID=749465 RepID=UPI001E8D4911|nr:heterokaryon incompatibility protein-domain-containing protein [Boeremia exigua]KAH6625452.1 heterokaryon incompatibility protein-domain-containing protein [Boeremia exigua]